MINTKNPNLLLRINPGRLQLNPRLGRQLDHALPPRVDINLNPDILRLLPIVVQPLGMVLLLLLYLIRPFVNVARRERVRALELCREALVEAEGPARVGVDAAARAALGEAQLHLVRAKGGALGADVGGVEVGCELVVDEGQGVVLLAGLGAEVPGRAADVVLGTDDRGREDLDERVLGLAGDVEG